MLSTLIRPLALVLAIALVGPGPATGQVTDERNFVVRSDSSGSVNDCQLRARSNQLFTDNALTFRARPRSQQVSVWVDPGFTIPNTFIDCLGNTVNVPAGLNNTQYVDLILDVASCRIQSDQGLAGDVDCCVEIRRDGALDNTPSPLATPGTIGSALECGLVHAIPATLKFVNSIPSNTCSANSLCGQNTGASLLVVGSGNCASATTVHELGHMQGIGHTCNGGGNCTDGSACPCSATFGGGGAGAGSCSTAANGGCPATGTCRNEIMWWTACNNVNRTVISANDCSSFQSGAQQ